VTDQRRIGLALLAAIGFGIVAALLKGTHAGTRQVYGNMSAPWLALAFLPGRYGRSIWRGAALGTLATALGLAGYCVATGVISDLGHHGLLGDLRLEFRANRYWFDRGLLSGPILGAFGAWSVRIRYATPLIVTGLLLVVEPVAVYAWSRLPTANAVLPGWAEQPGGPFVVEAVVGALAVLCGITVLARRRAADSG
jgi:hypothetical protein